ncbi:MAG: hypothetical protein ACPGUD_12525 [Parashewanella sp.]
MPIDFISQHIQANLFNEGELQQEADNKFSLTLPSGNTYEISLVGVNRLEDVTSSEQVRVTRTDREKGSLATRVLQGLGLTNRQQIQKFFTLRSGKLYQQTMQDIAKQKQTQMLKPPRYNPDYQVRQTQPYPEVQPYFPEMQINLSAQQRAAQSSSVNHSHISAPKHDRRLNVEQHHVSSAPSANSREQDNVLDDKSFKAIIPALKDKPIVGEAACKKISADLGGKFDADFVAYILRQAQQGRAISKEHRPIILKVVSYLPKSITREIQDNFRHLDERKPRHEILKELLQQAQPLSKGHHQAIAQQIEREQHVVRGVTGQTIARTRADYVEHVMNLVYQNELNSPSETDQLILEKAVAFYPQLQAQLPEVTTSRPMAQVQPRTRPSVTVPNTNRPPQSVARASSSHMQQVAKARKASNIPGFINRGNMCFANAALKQFIIANPRHVEPVAVAGRHQNCADMASALMHLSNTFYAVRFGQAQAEQSDQALENFWQAVTRFQHTSSQQLNADDKALQRKLNSLFNTDGQRQQDAEEFATLLTEISASRQASQELSTLTTRTAVEGAHNYQGERLGSAQSLYQVKLNMGTQKSLTECFEPQVSELDNYKWEQAGYRELPTTLTEMPSNPNPSSLQKLKIHSSMFSYSTAGNIRLSQESRALIGNGKRLRLPIMNSTTKEVESIDFRIRSLVMHSGGSSADVGYYYTLEQDENGDWYEHNDSRTSYVGTSITDYLAQHKSVAPYLIDLVRA